MKEGESICVCEKISHKHHDSSQELVVTLDLYQLLGIS